jgi:hypothetical protein
MRFHSTISCLRADDLVRRLREEPSHEEPSHEEPSHATDAPPFLSMTA